MGSPTITLRNINALNPCYNPEEIVFDSKVTVTPIELIKEWRYKFKKEEDLIWILCRKQYMCDKSQILFAVWCARESFKIQKELGNEIDIRSLNALDVAESFVFDRASSEDLGSARSVARSAARSAAESAQLDKLKEWFTTEDLNVFLSNKD